MWRSVCAIARNINTPIPVLEKLAHDYIYDDDYRNNDHDIYDNFEWVRYLERSVTANVVSNPKTPSSLLDKLANRGRS